MHKPKTVNKPKERPVLWDLYSRPGFLLRRANQIAMNIATHECARIGLTPPQHVCLIVLDRCPELDQISLGKALGIDRATVGQVLRRMEARGLVRRNSSPKDGRRKVVALTSEGRKLVHLANAVTLRASRRMLSALAPVERRTFVTLLAKAVTALNKESPTPVEPPPHRKRRSK